MSTSQQQQQDADASPPVVECRHPNCDRAGHHWTFQKGYCSTRHRYQDQGRRALYGLKYTHTRCFTCLSELKHIELPKPQWAFDETNTELTYNADKGIVETVWFAQEETRKAACGFQHRTPHATIGEKDAGEKVITGTICGECGSADYTEHISILADADRTIRFVRRYLADEDEEDFDPDVLERKYRETNDIELAAGAAIIACRD